MLALWLVAFGVLSRRVSSECGTTPIPPDLGSRIVGGVDAKPFSWPWQAQICDKFPIAGDASSAPHKLHCYHRCGGSLISDRWVMTAGHCAGSAFITFIRLGKFNLHDHEMGEISVLTDKVVRHPGFDQHTHNHTYGPKNDVAIYRLKQRVNFTEHVQPICLGRHDSSLISSHAENWVTGWGRSGRRSGEPRTSLLRQVKTNFIDYPTCHHDWPLVDDEMVCAGLPHKGPCNGDSGGPLVVAPQGSSSQWHQYGIVSWGSSHCAAPGEPGVFTRVSHYCDWIKQTTENEVECTQE